MSSFSLYVNSLSYGWCLIDMYINDKKITYDASYIGDNPLDSLICGCAELLTGMAIDDDYNIYWQAEPGTLKIKLHLDKKEMLHFDVYDCDDDDKIFEQWHEIVSMKDFVDGVIIEGFRVLNIVGLNGYRYLWLNDDFPLTKLLQITKLMNNFNNFDLSAEMSIIAQYTEIFKVKKETHFEQTTIYYDASKKQFEDSFAVGDYIQLTCILPKTYKDADGLLIDFIEENPLKATHYIYGKIIEIFTEWSCFSNDKKKRDCSNTEPIIEEQKHSLERNFVDNANRIFLGYILRLKDVIVKPLV